MTYIIYFFDRINYLIYRRSKESSGSAYDLGELDQALFMYLDGQQDHSTTTEEHRQTLNIFPSQPIHVQPLTTKGGKILDSPSCKKPSEPTMDSKTSNHLPAVAIPDQLEDTKAAVIQKEGNYKKGTSSLEHEGPKTPDPKTLRRLAQNREAARKSRIRKKAYIQQLETSSIKLNQIEQELQRARTQGLLFNGGAAVVGDQSLPTSSGLSSEAVMFDMEYARWLEEHHRLMCDLRAAVQEHLPENELRMFVDHCLRHYENLMNLKGLIIKSDVFYLISGIWVTPAERCFMWIAGFRPSDLLKALSHAMEALHRSLADAVVSDALSCPLNMPNYMAQMAIAMDKLTTLEDFVRQADNLRHQVLHRLQQMLTTRQMARCLLAIAEYFHRLRALSSLWLARPRHIDQK
ncbi:bZIP transcription factor TGA10 isoform X1 [Canna indica]|uniref:BZIP transcription factor TGA10 isoform X1 n=1 Tax=Canna indica TaxID=4628 RepID=A0AAQ3Q0F7_9LILI|nr:bZIP transcription factor TGA10 isoform X1 [Canna indica]